MAWNTIRLNILVVMMVFAIGFGTPLHSARAEMWGTNMIAALVQKMLDRLDRYIEGVLLSQLKSAAIKMLDKQVDQMFGGGGGSEALFVTDFREYIHGVSTNYAHDVMNDFFTTSMRGKFSVSNYVEVGGMAGTFANGTGLGMNAAAEVAQSMKSAVEKELPTFDFDTKSLNPGLRGGLSVRDLNQLVTNPMNNSIGASLQAKEMFYATLSEKEEIQKVKAQASGFIPKEKDGKVVAPAGLLEGMVVKVKTMSADVISTAENPEQLAAGVISSYANQVINRVVQQGLGKAESMIASKFGSVGTQVAREIGSGMASEGLGVNFSQETRQRGNAQPTSMSKTVNSGSTNASCIFCADSGYSFSSNKR
ncbi:MAG: hypothetical protein QG664_16 [Patescibacteria group bacterium]|nr:hypothetical protein [Patescibacteria group bacterium]